LVGRRDCEEDNLAIAAPPTSDEAQRSTIPGAFLAATRTHAGTAIRHKADGEWVDVPYAELGRIAVEIARGLIALGVKPGDRVAILAKTCPEWTYADCGALLAGAVVVPVYHTNSSEECQYVLEHAGARVLFCEDAEQLNKLDAIRDQVPALEHVIAFREAGERAIALSALREQGAGVAAEEVERRVSSVAPGDLCTIIYTSGTTGPPKGCMLTHGNLRADSDMVRSRLDFAADDVFYVFLPLAHVYMRGVQFLAMDAGATLAYWTGDMLNVLDELKEVKPTLLPSAPRLFEKIHARATRAVDEGNVIKRAIFSRALATGRRKRELERAGRSAGPLHLAQHLIGDQLALSKVRSLFGGRLKMAITGSAPIAPEILEFFAACGVVVLEGYGMTETSMCHTVNTPSEQRFGTVGKALTGGEIRIASDGEVLMRGANIFAGYYRNEEATAESLQDGWLHSGDLGELDADGFLKITGRKKDIIITSSGKNVAPSNVENALTQSPWISQAVVFGDRRPHLVALLTLDATEAPELAKGIGVSGTLEALATDPRVRAEIDKAVAEANSHFARIEQVKRYELLGRELSQAEGELTPSMKVKRQAVYSRHAETFEHLYEAGS
jgi:long-chain acyl-CoA synthetase